jgi:hypothetical protein
MGVGRARRAGRAAVLALADRRAWRGCRGVQRIDPAPGFRGDVAVDQLLSDLSFFDDSTVLVIDDLHELDSSDAPRWLKVFLLGPAFAAAGCVGDSGGPRLGLHRLRLAGQLTEVRGLDLRFSPEEAKELFREAGIALSDGGVALLYERTEGWATGRTTWVDGPRHRPENDRSLPSGDCRGSDGPLARPDGPVRAPSVLRRHSRDRGRRRVHAGDDGGRRRREAGGAASLRAGRPCEPSLDGRPSDARVHRGPRATRGTSAAPQDPENAHEGAAERGPTRPRPAAQLTSHDVDSGLRARRG